MQRVAEVRPLHIAKFAVPPYAGIEQHVHTLANALMPEVRSTVLAGNISKMRYGLRPYKLYTVKCYGKINSVYLTPKVLTQARQIMISGECNLLHLHCPNPWGDAAALACQGAPVVVSWHSDIVRQRWLMKAYQRIQRKVLDRADKIIISTPNFFQCSPQLNSRNIESKIAYVPYGIDFSELDSQSRDEEIGHKIEAFAAGRCILLTVGRHVAYKGYETLLNALSNTRNHTCLVMVGSGPLTNSYRRLIKEQNLTDRVLMLGEISRQRLATPIRSCHFFALPSITTAEAFGLASAEAMAFGKPTIVCRLNNGVDYLNQHAITSLCVNPGSVRELSEAITTLATDGKLRETLGLAARKWVRREFGVCNMRVKMMEVYQAIG